MHRRKALLILTLATFPLAGASGFSGESALQWTKDLVALGPRPSGSAAMAKTQALILQRLKEWKVEVQEDRFEAQTPAGRVRMMNIIGRIPGTSGKAVAVSGHYDTKRLPGKFVGANDGGASAGFLLELARTAAGKPRKDDLYIVFFDGEEAVKDWTDTDSLYGSRHLAAKWAADGTLGKLKALINVDMIGDRDLGILQEEYSSPTLVRLFWSVARELGHGAHFLNYAGAVQDDHFPFLARGVPAIDLIDFDYGPRNSWWHTSEDTPDKLSAKSFQVVGDVTIEVLRRLERQ